MNTFYENQQKEIKTIRERTLTLRLSDADVKRICKKAGSGNFWKISSVIWSAVHIPMALMNGILQITGLTAVALILPPLLRFCAIPCRISFLKMWLNCTTIFRKKRNISPT